MPGCDEALKPAPEERTLPQSIVPPRGRSGPSGDGWRPPPPAVAFSRRGGRHLLVTEQRVAAALGECFAFFSDAGNLERITPPFLRFQILTPLPIRMRTGALIEYRLSLMGLPLTWRSRIEDWRPGAGFTDVQLRGPYAHWIHRHSFRADGHGTWVRDEVEYALPLAPLSDPIHALFVRPRLREIFGHRRAAIARLLG